MQNILVHIPFSSPWIIRYHLSGANKILDVGCGDGSLMAKVNPDCKYEITGVELYKPYLEKAEKSRVYKRLIAKDIKKINFKKKSFDVVVASQVIEHLEKTQALRLIKKIEKMAKDKVILTTPKGFVKYDPFEVKDANKLQKHCSGWEINELRKMGYSVYGQGNGLIYRPTGLLYRYRKFKNILMIISFFLAPITYFLPETGAYIVSVKKL